MNSKKRAILIVLDSVGVGYLPDADQYGDEGANTLGHIAENVQMNLPVMQRMGLGNIIPLKGIAPVAAPEGCYGKCAEASQGKDTVTGHWEIGGIVLPKQFPTYPNGFPESVIKKFEEKTGFKTIGNYAASGTEIIKELGDEHVNTKKLIVYTSADSVFQIAAHEEIVPIPELYRICEIARNEVLVGEHAVGRIIARPFIGKSGEYKRTSNRHDYSLPPVSQTICDILKQERYDVAGVGKIYDIFAGSGITRHVHTSSNMDGCLKTVEYMDTVQSGLIFTNLVDFDMLYGHRNDAEGYAKALEQFDAFLPSVTSKMRPDDILILTADHGCDPLYKGTDHTREYIPILVYGEKIKKGVNLGVRKSYGDIARTIAAWFDMDIFPKFDAFEVF